jgi:hypothetical protein
MTNRCSSRIVRFLLIGAAIAPLALLAACVPTLQPIYTEKDLIFDPALVGVWRGEHDDDTWEFTKAGEKGYLLTMTGDSEGPVTFSAHLVKIQDATFLDLFPGGDLNCKGASELTWLKVHSFFLVREIGASLNLGYMDMDWLESYLTQHPEEIRHEKVDDRILLTASTEELQAFLHKHVATEGAFPKNAEPLKKK